MQSDLRYRKGERIATGGMSTVYRGIDTVLGREVAIKVIHPHLLGDPQALKRFDNEAKAVASLSHDNIVRLFDYGNDGDSRFLVMELIDGCTLQELLERSGTMPNYVCMEMFRQMFSGLCAAHGAGIIHRDIKPSNIMVSRAGAVKLMDFGIAHLTGAQSLTVTASFLGSPQYSSPEIAAGLPATERSDTFSAGMVLYECCTGKKAFDRNNVQATLLAVLNEEPPRASVACAKVLPDMERFILDCMAKDPCGRPDARGAVERLDRMLGDTTREPVKDRIHRFLSNPDTYRAEEERQIGELYRDRARSIYRKSPVSALRSYSTAEAFIALDNQDRAIIKRIHRKSALRRTGIRAAAALLVLTALIAVVRVVPVRDHAARITQPRQTAAAPLSPVQPRFSSGAGTPLSTVASVKTSAVQPRVKPVRQTVRAPHPAEPPAPVDTAIHPVATGRVQIKTNPPWAQVTIDGLPAGNTPLDIIVKTGGHSYSVRKKGCIEESGEFTIAGSDTFRRELVLKRE